ncbi:MAG: DUF1636 domain-containing protein [Pseudomonadota bacterium]
MFDRDDDPPPAELLVCVKCRAGLPSAEDAPTPGRRLYDALAAAGAPEGVTLTAVDCLQNCGRGCTVALRGGPSRWTYVYGDVDAAEGAVTIREGAEAYRRTRDGLIPWRERSQHFRKHCIARIPPLEPAHV